MSLTSGLTQNLNLQHPRLSGKQHLFHGPYLVSKSEQCVFSNGRGTENPTNQTGESTPHQTAGLCAGDKNPHSFTQAHRGLKKHYPKEKKSELQKEVLWVLWGLQLFLSYFLP